MREVLFTTAQAPGAIPNGTSIEKVNSLPEDGHKDGAPGIVVGSLGPLDEPDLPKYGYCVRWEDFPVPVFVSGDRIRVRR